MAIKLPRESNVIEIQPPALPTRVILVLTLGAIVLGSMVGVLVAGWMN